MNDTNPIPRLAWLFASALLVGGLGAASRTQGDRDEWPEMVRQIYAGRDEGRAVLRADAADAVERGLQWLLLHQDDDGRWDCDGFMKHDEDEKCDGVGNGVHDVGVTGLALLAMLAEGRGSAGAAYADSIAKGVAWLRSQQGDNGLIGTNLSHNYIYGHAIATYAACETYGLFGDPEVGAFAQRALDYLEAHRNPFSVWRYQPRDNDNDLSVTSWCIAATKAGREFGLNYEAEVFDRALAFLDSVSDRSGRHGYTKAGENSSRYPGDHLDQFPPDVTEPLTACGVFLRFRIGQRSDDTPVIAAAFDRLDDRLPAWQEGAGCIDFYHYYYGSLASYQAGGQIWSRWQQRLRAALLPVQRADGPSAGSWDPISVWGEEGGRAYSTAMAVLSLQAAYRYARFAEVTPLPDDAIFRAPRAKWQRGDYGAFAAALDRIAASEPTPAQSAQIEAARAVLAEFDEQVRRMVAAIEEGAVYTRFERIEKVARRHEGLPAGELAEEIRKRWSKDRDVRREIKAADELHKLRRYAEDTRVDAERLIERVERFTSKYEGTKAAASGRSWIQMLKQRAGRRRD